MTIGIVIQARIGSSRFRGKVLKPLAGNSMLYRIIHRADKATRPDSMIAAVPFGSSNGKVAEEAETAGANVVRGSEDDVLARFIQTILRHNLDLVVRLTADNPFVDAKVIDAMIDRFLKTDIDYLHNVRNSGYPLGTSVEVVRSSALEEAFVRSDQQADHEHVTSYVYRRDKGYQTAVFRRDEPVDDIRLTVDTQKDYQLASWIYENIDEPPAEFNLDDVLRLRDENPEQFRLNQSVQQKSVHE